MSEAKPYISLIRRLRDEPTEAEFTSGISGQTMRVWNDLCLKAADRIEQLERERDAFKSAAKILKGCLDDAVELGLTVAICGIEPDVLQAITTPEGE